MEFYGKHPNLDSLELYLLNQLHLHDQRTIADHLHSCGNCQVMAERLLEQIDVIREAMLVA